MPTVTTPENAIQVEMTPQEVALAFQDKTMASGFMHRDLTIQNIKYVLSYDGESELIGMVISKPRHITNSYAEVALKDYFGK